MKTGIAAAVMAAGLTLFAFAAIGSAAAADSKAGIHATDASTPTDLSARRRYRHYRHHAYRRYDRPYYPAYYDRPYYYAPAPFFPLFGLGYGPWW
jgi:hypothetical protein